MTKTEKMYAVAIAILVTTLIGVCITGIMLKNENRVMHKVLELSCQTTYDEQKCLEGIETYLKNPELIQQSYNQYLNRNK